MNNDHTRPSANDSVSASLKDQLIHMAYVSTQTRDMEATDLLKLLQEARALNASRDITGLLLHKNESFFQVLEGRREQVMATFESITRDERHEGVEVLFDEALEEREFSDWRMGFIDLDGIDVSMLQGYSDFFNSNDEPRAFLKALSRGERLALLFRDLG